MTNEALKIKGINKDWYIPCDTDDKIKILNRQLTGNSELFESLRCILKRMTEQKDAGEWAFGDPSHYEKVVYYEGYKKALKDLERVLPKEGG